MTDLILAILIIIPILTFFLFAKHKNVFFKLFDLIAWLILFLNLWYSGLLFYDCYLNFLDCESTLEVLAKESNKMLEEIIKSFPRDD